jgi:hypothetical protein
MAALRSLSASLYLFTFTLCETLSNNSAALPGFPSAHARFYKLSSTKDSSAKPLRTSTDK